MCHLLSVPARISMCIGRVECHVDSPFDCDQIELWIVILQQVLVFLWIFFCVCMRLEYYKDRIDMGIDWGFAYQIYNRDCFGISNKRSWSSWSNNAHGTQCTRRESGRWSWWFNCYADKIEYKPSWRIFRELRSWSVWDIYCRNTAMAKVTWPIRC